MNQQRRRIYKRVLSEKHFEQQVRDYLETVEGWRCFHLEECWSEVRKRSFGEAGMPDLLCVRYSDRSLWDLPAASRAIPVATSATMWIELKRPGGKARASQKLWHLHERKLGALTLIAGEDFAADYDGFLAWYTASGLRRRL